MLTNTGKHGKLFSHKVIHWNKWSGSVIVKMITKKLYTDLHWLILFTFFQTWKINRTKRNACCALANPLLPQINSLPPSLSLSLSHTHTLTIQRIKHAILQPLPFCVFYIILFLVPYICLKAPMPHICTNFLQFYCTYGFSCTLVILYSR